MSANEPVMRLTGDILKAVERIARIDSYYRDFCGQRKALREHSYDLVILAEIFVDFSTCLETAFVRISKFFENNLDGTKWHSELLERMIIDIPGLRPRLLNDDEYNLLLEFLRFRHFRRYYFQFNYDRDKMDFLEKKFLQLLPKVNAALNDYAKKLDRFQ